MSAESDLALIREQESTFVFESFDEDVAFALGARIRDIAKAGGLGIAMGVFLWDRTMFYAATRGGTAGNRQWIEGKLELVRLTHKSSYRVVLERGERPRVLEAGWGNTRTAIAGGAFPIAVRNAGIIGAAVVSGLHEREDHELARRAIAEVQGRPGDHLALPAL